MKVCVFCEIVRNDAHHQILRKHYGCIVIEPLNPVTPGHLLVIPTHHVDNAATVPVITGATMAAASEEARAVGGCNIITSVGPSATQTVPHLHLHIVPRKINDGLLLPWSNQHEG